MRYLVNALLSVVLFGCASNSPSDESRNSLKNAQYQKAESNAILNNMKPYTMVLGDEKAVQVAFHSPELVKSVSRHSPDRRTYIVKAGNNDGFNISMFSELESSTINSNEGCLNKYWSKDKNPLKEFIVEELFSTAPHFELVRIRIEMKRKGRLFRMEDGRAYFFKDGRCFDIHVSQVLFDNTYQGKVDMFFDTLLYK